MEFRHLVRLKNFPLHPKLSGSRWPEAAGHCDCPQTSVLKVWRDWSPILFGPENKASGSQALADHDPPLTKSLNLATLVVGMPASGTGVVKPPVGSSSQLPFPEWPVAGRVRGKR